MLNMLFKFLIHCACISLIYLDLFNSIDYLDKLRLYLGGGMSWNNAVGGEREGAIDFKQYWVFKVFVKIKTD